jgi:hypothetical protein
MKKVAIITITNSGLNFGNRLQNYALQKKLEQYGVFPETILSSNVCMNSLILSCIRRIAKRIVKASGRRRCFERFGKKNIRYARRIRYGKLNETEFSKEYDAFIVGSDQVWNPNFHFNSDFEFMVFTQPGKRYSYAASFGADNIPEEFLEKYKEWLSQMHTISVREESGRNLIKALTGKEAFVHIDPVMLLTSEDYQKIEEEPRQKIPERYLLVYFLGEVPETYKLFIAQMAEKLCLKILELSELPNTPLYNIGPQHFLYLFRHADYICTDSFHGTAMSVIYGKQFTVFYRKDKDVPMNARIDSLLHKMDLFGRLYGRLTVEQSCMPIDYEKEEKILEKERNEAEHYLKNLSLSW